MKRINVSLAISLCLSASLVMAGEPSKPAKDKKKTSTTLQLQVQDQAGRMAADIAQAQVSNLLAPAANGQAQAQGGPMASHLSQALDATLTQSLSGNGNSAAAVGNLRGELSQGAANALAVPLTQALGSKAPVEASGLAGGLQHDLQQGLQQELSSEIQKHAGGAQVQPGPGLQSTLQTAAKGRLTSGAQQQLSQALPLGQKPLAHDLLVLGLNRSGVEVPGATGSFTPPAESPLGTDSSAMRTGLNILSNSQGQAGLGVKGNVDVGAQKLEISGTLDPNSNAEQGKSAGVQIKIGGD